MQIFINHLKYLKLREFVMEFKEVLGCKLTSEG